MVGWSPEGSTGDTLIPPDFNYDPPRLSARGERSESHNPLPFAPRMAWALSPSGAIIAGVATDYQIEIHHDDGTVTNIHKENWERIPVLPAESEWHRETIIVWNRVVQPDWTWNGPSIPETKPAYNRLHPDRSGRIWVIRPGPGERIPGGAEGGAEPQEYFFNPLWRDRPLVDVFLETGEYLGEVELPRGIKWLLPVPYIEGDAMIAATEDDEGVIRVHRYRLVIPE
jgi:hypothetical protein